MATEYTWNGTGLKYAVSMTCEGFSMEEDDWSVEIRSGKMDDFMNACKNENLTLEQIAFLQEVGILEQESIS